MFLLLLTYCGLHDKLYVADLEAGKENSPMNDHVLAAAAAAKWKKDSPVFLSSLISGIFAYGFIMFNVLHNWDSIVEWPGGYGTGIESGRWLLQLLGDFFGKVWGNYAPPLFTIMISVTLLSLSACVVVSVLGIRSRLLSMIAAVLFMVFPTVGCTMIYTFTAHYYSFAVLLAALGVYTTVKYKYGALAGAVLFACSMGIYQAYMPLAASLFVIVLLRRAVTSGADDERGPGELIFSAVSYLFSLAAGFLIYFLFLHLFLNVYGAELTGYQGVSEMGFKLSELPQIIARAYGEMALLPSQPFYGVNDTALARFAVRASYDISTAMLLYFLFFRHAKISYKIISVLLYAVLPLAVNSIVLLSYHSYIHLLMVYAIVCVFLLPIVLLDGLRERTEDANMLRRRLSALALAAVVAVSSAVSLNYIWQSNGNYMVLSFTNTQMTEYFGTIVTRVKSAEGYRDDLKFAVIGDKIDDAAYTNLAYESSPFRYSGVPDDPVNIYSRVFWMYYYLGFDPVYATPEEREALRSMPEVADMPRYPDDGSVAVVGDFVVLRIDDAEK